MSRLDKLIQELCPDGVKYVDLGEVAEIRSGWGFPNAEQGLKSGDYPFFKVGDMNNIGNEMYMKTANNYVSRETAKKLRCNPSPAGTILFPKIGAAIGTNKKRIAVSDCCYDNNVMGIIASKKILSRFLFYIMESIELISFADYSGAMPSIRKSTIEKYRIPVPPLPVQEEIVRILDNFTELTTELTTELEARKTQYEYYRDELFTRKKWSFRQIKEIATTNIGLATSVTKHKVSEGVLLLHNSDIQQNSIVLKQREYISEAFAQKNAKKILQNDDIITVHTGDVGTSAVIAGPYVGAIGFTTITTRICDKSVIEPQYLCHYLNSNKCKTDIAAMTISDRSNLNQSSFEKLLIPIPPVEEQRRIVAILDRFDALCNDLSSGLPAEIEARKKQYEYYRDKLLTFKELGA